MSRRYRIEEAKAKQHTCELKEEEDKLKLKMERIFGPIVWRRVGTGIRIQDLKPNYYNSALDMIIDYFIIEDVIFRNMKFADDQESIDSFRAKLLHSMKDNSSIIAIDEENEGEVAGVLIMKAVKKCDFGRVFSRVQLADGKAYENVIELTSYLNRQVDVFAHFDCEIYLRYYLLCIKPAYRRKNLGHQLMHVGIDIARHLNISVIMGLFSCFKMQKIAKSFGMRTLHEINYVKWTGKSGEVVFCEPGAGNYTCALMAGPVPPLPQTDPVGKDERIDGPKSRLTRAEKRKSKFKKN